MKNNTPSYIEDHSSQIPALLMLCRLGYSYLTPEQVDEMRGSRSNVLLKPVLEEQLRKINRVHFKEKLYPFSNHNISEAIQKISDIPMVNGLIKTNEKLYRLLTLGTSFEEAIEGDLKSFSLNYIDWENPGNNVFHVAEEFSVLRPGSYRECRPDIVLFVNGIPLVVIECRRPDLKIRDKNRQPVDEAVLQHLSNQEKDGIPNLYAYSQLLLGLAVNGNKYATTGTPFTLWNYWKEKFETRDEEFEAEQNLFNLKNITIDKDLFDTIFSGRFGYIQSHFEALRDVNLQPGRQDLILNSLCQPEWLLRFIKQYMIYDAGEKKAARYQQFHAVEKTLRRIQDTGERKRKGGVIWHTQGSGKSLAMVLLAKGIALDKSISDSRIVLVTDDMYPDDQINKTFDNCDLEPVQATTGNELIRLIREKKRAIITTEIKKLETVIKRSNVKEESPDIFILVDEAHKTMYGTANTDIQQAFPNACIIAFTGNPLMKQEKKAALQYGGFIDTYKHQESIDDNNTVPLLYENRRIAPGKNKTHIDTYSDRISERMNRKEKSDLKTKFSRGGKLSGSDQKLMTLCYDISEHFSGTWQGTGFKGQLTVHSKAAAIKCKLFLDEFGKVSSEVLISGPGMREGGEATDEKSTDIVQHFWKKMMEHFGTEKEYHKQLIHRFKWDEEPDILIVVDKLITGFNAPRNIVLYIARNLKEHHFLQAIARVNRPAEGKDFGYIIDYHGNLDEPDETVVISSIFESFEEAEIKSTLTSVNKEIEKLSGRHEQTGNVFKKLGSNPSTEACEQYLFYESLREDFYDRLSYFARTLKLALSTFHFELNTNPEKVKQYKEDLLFFVKLRKSVKARYSDPIDNAQYEKQVRKLIATHISSGTDAELIRQAGIYERDTFEQELAGIKGNAAKADTIAYRTKQAIALNMDDDPVLFKTFSKRLEQVISDWRAKQLSDGKYLKKVREIMEKVQSRTADTIPRKLKSNQLAQAVYGIINELTKTESEGARYRSEIPDIGLRIDEIIQNYLVVDWKQKQDIIKKMEQEIDDYLYSLKENGVDLTLYEMDEIIEKSIELAKNRY
ncbi:MAG: HsdR family type I site-specific deoxyribonuclease [Balneolaceae bacterium]